MKIRNTAHVDKKIQSAPRKFKEEKKRKKKKTNTKQRVLYIKPNQRFRLRN